MVKWNNSIEWILCHFSFWRPEINVNQSWSYCLLWVFLCGKDYFKKNPPIRRKLRWKALINLNRFNSKLSYSYEQILKFSYFNGKNHELPQFHWKIINMIISMGKKSRNRLISMRKSLDNSRHWPIKINVRNDEWSAWLRWKLQPFHHGKTCVCNSMLVVWNKCCDFYCFLLLLVWFRA